MWIVAIAWIYVALMMALSEATSPIGTVLGAIVTFVFYGVLPTALVMYLLGTPGRRRARQAKEAAEQAAHDAQKAEDQAAAAQDPSTGQDGDAGRLPAGDAIASERKEAG